MAPRMSTPRGTKIVKLEEDSPSAVANTNPAASDILLSSIQMAQPPHKKVKVEDGEEGSALDRSRREPTTPMILRSNVKQEVKEEEASPLPPFNFKFHISKEKTIEEREDDIAITSRIYNIEMELNDPSFNMISFYEKENGGVFTASCGPANSENQEFNMEQIAQPPEVVLKMLGRIQPEMGGYHINDYTTNFTPNAIDSFLSVVQNIKFKLFVFSSLENIHPIGDLAQKICSFLSKNPKMTAVELIWRTQRHQDLAKLRMALKFLPDMEKLYLDYRVEISRNNSNNMEQVKYDYNPERFLVDGVTLCELVRKTTIGAFGTVNCEPEDVLKNFKMVQNSTNEHKYVKFLISITLSRKLIKLAKKEYKEVTEEPYRTDIMDKKKIWCMRVSPCKYKKGSFSGYVVEMFNYTYHAGMPVQHEDWMKANQNPYTLLCPTHPVARGFEDDYQYHPGY